MKLSDVLATTCPLCAASTPDPCGPGIIHTARVRAAERIAAAVAALRREQHRVATARGRRHHVEAALEGDPFAIADAVFNRQVLAKPPSRLKTSPYPIVGTGREFQG